jgi:hypothetical protein
MTASPALPLYTHHQTTTRPQPKQFYLDLALTCSSLILSSILCEQKTKPTNTNPYQDFTEKTLMGIFSLVTGWAGPSGFGSASTAEQVTEGIDASKLTAIITGM